MDHDGAFTAEDNVDTVNRIGRRRSRTGEDTMLLAAGGVDKRTNGAASHHGDAHTEDTPLLRTSEESSEYSEPQRPAWTPGSEYEHLPWYKRPSAFWLLGPFVFSALAFGGIMVPKINLILGLICREYFADKDVSVNPGAIFATGFNEVNPACRTPEVQKQVTAFTLQGGLISGILAAIVAPKLGALSDRFGRKPIMCITNAGMLTGEVITIFAAKYPETFNVKWLLLGYFFDGLCGSFIASMALSNSYTADCTPPNHRNVIFGYFHGCLFTGIALGPLVAGYIIKATGDVIVMFYIALGCHVSFIFFLLFVIPESLSKARQHAAREKYKFEHQPRVFADGHEEMSWKQKLQKYNIFEPLKILYPTGPGSSPAVRRNLLLLAAVDMIIFGVAMGAMSIVILYSNYVLGWTTFEQSIFVSVVNTSRVVVLIVILPAITWLYRGSPGRRSSRPSPTDGTDFFELTILRTGIFFDFIGFIGYTLSRQSWAFIASGAVASVGGIGSPTLQAALTKHVPPDRVGQLLGAMGLLHSIARVIAPLIFNGIYLATINTFPQTVFVILTVMFGMAFFVSWLVRPGVKLEEVGDIHRRESRMPDNTDASVGI